MIQQIAQTGVTSFSVELMPRTTRAQSMDALSSHGHDLRLQSGADRGRHAAQNFSHADHRRRNHHPRPRFRDWRRSRRDCRPIATARRLGAVVSAYDLRPASKEQVQSLGGRFVELPIEAKDAQDARGYGTAQDETFYAKQRELLARVVAESDVVITTAVVPGKKAPVLVTAEMVKGMAPGSVIFDLACERGGNCELTQSGKTIVEPRGHDHWPHQHRDRSPVSRQPDVRAQCHRISFASGERGKAADSIWRMKLLAKPC